MPAQSEVIEAKLGRHDVALLLPPISRHALTRVPTEVRTTRAFLASTTRLTPVNTGKARIGGLSNGRYWARTSDLRLVEAALSQLS